jgi:hypothetical protein
MAMSRMMAVSSLVLLVACGSKSSTSPAAPSTTATSVAVSVSSPIRMGQTAQATGTAALSNGQTQAVTSGWRSDAPAVASVTDGGLVSALTNGRATIYVVSGGRQGQQVVRVVPDYQGRWFGALRVVSCTASGLWADIGFCDFYPVGDSGSFVLSFAQSGESMSATIDYGEGILFPPVNASVQDDGGSSFASTLTTTTSDVTLSVTANFAVSSSRVGELTGTGADRWTAPNVPGEGRVAFALENMSRTSATARMNLRGAKTSVIHNMLRRLSEESH